MTKMVKFTRVMSPHLVGEERAVPDDVARRLVDEGSAVVVPSIFDAQALETKKRLSFKTRKG